MSTQKQTKSFWINQKTGKTEIFTGLPPANRMCEFIPQSDAEQGLFSLYVDDMKKTPAEALELVLRACVQND